MDKRVKALFVEALRSGEYNQAEGQLRREEVPGKPSFCCLGVLCEVAIKDGLNVSYDPERWQYDEQTAFLPFSVREWAGFPPGDDSGRLEERIEYIEDGWDSPMLASSLLALNDGAEYTFEQIADVIEKQF